MEKNTEIRPEKEAKKVKNGKKACFERKIGDLLLFFSLNQVIGGIK